MSGLLGELIVLGGLGMMIFALIIISLYATRKKLSNKDSGEK
jgi:hypothetical protein